MHVANQGLPIGALSARRTVAIIALLSLLASMLVFAGPTRAATDRWVSNTATVGGNTSCADPGFNTINAAMTAAVAGDTIRVCAGTYVEDVAVSKNGLQFLGANVGTAAGPAAVPAGRGPESILQGRFTFGADRPGTVIDGFTIQSGTVSAINAFRGVGNQALNNILIGTPAASGVQAGIGVQSLRNMVLANNHITGYRQGVNLDGGAAAGGDQTIIEANYVTGTTSSAIIFNASATNGHIVRNNVLAGNATGIVISQGEHQITGNTINNNTGTGIFVQYINGSPVNGLNANARLHDLYISRNILHGNLRGLSFTGTLAATSGNHTVLRNSIVANPSGGLTNFTPAASVDATCNWWGSASGPAPSGSGNSVSGASFNPWLVSSDLEGDCPAANELTVDDDPVTVTAGDLATNGGDYTLFGGPYTLSASVGTVTPPSANGTGSWSWEFQTTSTADSQTVTIEARDGDDAVVASVDFELVVESGDPPVTPFADLTITKGEVKADSWKLEGTFTLGEGSNGIDWTTEPVTLQIGSYSVTLPPGSFSADGKYGGTVNGVALKIQLTDLGGGTYGLKAEGKGGGRVANSNPVPVSLTIGDDSGSTMANLKM
jgi:hypothetical protein